MKNLIVWFGLDCAFMITLVAFIVKQIFVINDNKNVCGINLLLVMISIMCNVTHFIPEEVGSGVIAHYGT